MKQQPTPTTSPKDYEELIRLIHERHDQMSKTYQRIAVYLTQLAPPWFRQPVSTAIELHEEDASIQNLPGGYYDLPESRHYCL